MRFPSYETSDEHVARIARKLSKELPGRIIGPVEYAESTSMADARDERSAWRRFVESTRPITGTIRTLTIDVPMEGRPLTVMVHIGGERPQFHHPVCLGLAMSVSSKLGGGAAEHRLSTGRFEGRAAAALDADRELRRLLRSLLAAGYTGGITGFDARFALEVGRVVVETTPQETWGGFVLRLGAALFLEAAFRAEALAVADSVASRVLP